MLLPVVFDSLLSHPGYYHQRKREPLLSLFDDQPAYKIRREMVQKPQDDRYVMKIDCRGYGPEDLKIDIENNLLVVNGHVIAGDETSSQGSLERMFTRKIPIPEELDRETLKSDFKDGVLIITGDKKQEEPKRIRIPINVVRKTVTPPPTPIQINVSGEKEKVSEDVEMTQESNKENNIKTSKDEKNFTNGDSHSSNSTDSKMSGKSQNSPKKVIPSDNPEVEIEIADE